MMPIIPIRQLAATTLPSNDDPPTTLSTHAGSATPSPLLNAPGATTTAAHTTSSTGGGLLDVFGLGRGDTTASVASSTTPAAPTAATSSGGGLLGLLGLDDGSQTTTSAAAAATSASLSLGSDLSPLHTISATTTTTSSSGNSTLSEATSIAQQLAHDCTTSLTACESTAKNSPWIALGCILGILLVVLVIWRLVARGGGSRSRDRQ